MIPWLIRRDLILVLAYAALDKQQHLGAGRGPDESDQENGFFERGE